MRLTDRQLMKASLRALYLWEFGDDEITSKLKVSDKELLAYFATEWIGFVKHKKPIAYTDAMINKLIYSCGMRTHNVTNRKRPNINIFFNSPKLLQSYTTSLQVQKNKKYITARSNVTNLGKLLDPSRGSRGNYKGFGTQSAFASRILFFAIPNMQFFNYSTTLQDRLKDEWKVKGVDLKKSYAKMNQLLNRYESQLKKLPRPNFDKDIKEFVEQNNWWERRVLDLAVLHNWECFCRD
jgi:hypothetical protein